MCHSNISCCTFLLIRPCGGEELSLRAGASLWAYVFWRKLSLFNISNESATSIKVSCQPETVTAVVGKSVIISIASAMPIISAGIPSWAKTTEKHIIPVPGTGGDQIVRDKANDEPRNGDGKTTAFSKTSFRYKQRRKESGHKQHLSDRNAELYELSVNTELHVCIIHICVERRRRGCCSQCYHQCWPSFFQE